MFVEANVPYESRSTDPKSLELYSLGEEGTSRLGTGPKHFGLVLSLEDLGLI